MSKFNPLSICCNNKSVDQKEIKFDDEAKSRNYKLLQNNNNNNNKLSSSKYTKEFNKEFHTNKEGLKKNKLLNYKIDNKNVLINNLNKKDRNIKNIKDNLNDKYHNKVEKQSKDKNKFIDKKSYYMSKLGENQDSSITKKLNLKNTRFGDKKNIENHIQIQIEQKKK